MNHKHDFKIILKEVLPDNTFKFTKQCKNCPVEIIELSKTGDWIR